jgi:DNA-binding NtrC family response regulator
MSRFFQAHGFEVREAESAVSAEAEFRSARPDLAILDYYLGPTSGLELLPVLKEIDQHVPIVMLTGYGTIDLAVQALKQGVDHFLEKPVAMSSLLAIVERILVSQRDRRQQASSEASDLDLSLGEIERRHIERVLASVGGSVDRAAARLQISRSSLYERLRRFRSVS